MVKRHIQEQDSDQHQFNYPKSILATNDEKPVLYISRCYHYNLAIRTIISLHISGLIGNLMQGHVGISMMWRDSEAREKGHCFAKQPPNKLKFMTIYDESNTIT